MQLIIKRGPANIPYFRHSQIARNLISAESCENAGNRKTYFQALVL
jgi:hypothetical protein